MSKSVPAYKVIFISDDHIIKNNIDQIVIVPSSFESEGRVVYLEFPFAPEDIETMECFLKLPIPSPLPAGWPTYNCQLLSTYSKNKIFPIHCLISMEVLF